MRLEQFALLDAKLRSSFSEAFMHSWVRLHHLVRSCVLTFARENFRVLTLTYSCPGRGGVNLTPLSLLFNDRSGSPSILSCARLDVHPIYLVTAPAPGRLLPVRA